MAPGFVANDGDPFVPYWRDHVAGLAERVEATVVPLRYPVTRGPYRAAGALVVPLGRGDVRLRRSPALWRDAVAAVAERHRRRPFDLVHALQAGEAGMVGALAAAAIRRPLVVHVAGGELVRLPEIGYGALSPFERLAAAIALGAARVVTCGSAAMRDVAARRLGRRAGAVRVAPLGLRAARFRAIADRRAARPASGPPEIVAVANLNPVKGHATLLAAFAALPPSLDARLSLVGFGPLAGPLRDRARRLGIHDRVRWWGAVPHPAIHVPYERAAAFAASSHHEAQGIAALEAATAGLPIAATRVGALARRRAGTLHHAPIGSPEGMAGALAAALDHAPGEAQALADAVAGAYDLDACTARFLDAYRAARAR